MLKLKLQCFGHLMPRADSLEDPDAGKDRRQEEKGMTEDEMCGWHQQLNGHEFEQILGDGEGQGSLAFCRPWGSKESDATEQLNNSLKTPGSASCIAKCGPLDSLTSYLPEALPFKPLPHC